MHDGSQMTARFDDDARTLEISYAEPPAMLREIGVTPGQVLVRGKWDGAVLLGEAFVFSPHCAPEAYPIRGLIDRDGDLLVLGPVPTSCGGPKEWNAASVMRFAPVSTMPERKAKPKKKAEPKEQRAKPKPKPKPRPQPQPQPQYQQPYYPWRW